MSFECGRTEKCGPCESLAEPYSSTACEVVSMVVRQDLSQESSLASIRDAVWAELDKVRNVKVTHRMRTGTFASTVDLLLSPEDN